MTKEHRIANLYRESVSLSMIRINADASNIGSLSAVGRSNDVTGIELYAVSRLH